MKKFFGLIGLMGVSSLSYATILKSDVLPDHLFIPTQQVIEKTVVITPPPLKMDYQLSYGNDNALKKAYHAFLTTGKAPNIETQGFEQFAYDMGEQPIVATRPLELTVISLEPGEQVTNVSSGDPTRWSYSMAYSGVEHAQQAHIMIKPSQLHISTDLVITTDRRLYTLKMVSTEEKYVRNVRFWYPKDLRTAWQQGNEKILRQAKADERQITSTDIQLDHLNFDYALIKQGWGKTPAFKPVRVFDDGKHTFIQFPESIKSQELPALFVVNGQRQEMVNYRSKPPYFVIDKTFKEALLITGVGKQQQRLRIHNRKGMI